jgi:hypothetical protein
MDRYNRKDDYKYVISYFHGVTWVIVNNKPLDEEILEKVKKYRSLMFICLDNNIQLLDNVLCMLPLDLESLYLEVSYEWSLTKRDSKLNVSLLNLPLNLKYLEINISDFNENMDNLPISLKTLIITSNIFDHELNNLPNELERLEIRCEYTKPIENIPLTMKFLNMSSFYPYLKDIKLKMPKIKFNNIFTNITFNY